MPSAAVVQVVEHEEAYLHKNQSRLIMYVRMYAKEDEQSSDEVPSPWLQHSETKSMIQIHTAVTQLHTKRK